jgi:hypothetical protein
MRKAIQKCLKVRQYLGTVLLLITSTSVFASGSLVSRKPANFVPDDDLIVVPMTVERNFYQEFNEKHKDQFRASRLRLENWIAQEQYAQDYGLEDAGFIELPTVEVKERFFRRNYLRFIQKDVERSNNETLQDITRQWTADDEIDSIKNNEQRSDFIVKAKRSSGRKVIKATETVKVAGQKFKFDIQPRLEMGMVKIRLDIKYIHVRAWVGVNGNQEINMNKTFKATGTSTLVNYYIEQNRVLAAVDQTITDHWSARLTHEKIGTDFDNMQTSGLSENNILSFNFRMGF